MLSIYRLLPVIILIEGFVSISIEILTIRQMLPFAGGSVVVTSFIIGFFLLFLALGYRSGGRCERNLKEVLQFNFLLSSLWLGLGLSYVFIALFFYVTQKILGENILYFLVGYLLIVIAPLIYTLGKTIPITMTLNKQDRSVALIGGDTLGLSTLGSFLGAILTALILMHYCGVAWTIFINSILLCLLALLLVEKKKVFFIFTSAIFLSVLVYCFNIKIENKLFVTTNNYANYQITKDNEKKVLIINNSKSSSINNQQKGFGYIEYIKKVLFEELKFENKKILILGAGGFTLSAENYHNNQFDYVDIDGQIRDIVTPQFIKKINGSLITDDARHYIHSTKNHYDAIVVDTYSDLRSIPAYLLTYEYLKELKQRVTENGVVLFNIIANPTLQDAYSKRVDNTIREIFKSCMSVPITYVNNISNIVYICSLTSNQEDKTIYSDNRNTSTLDSFEWKYSRS